jgi:hypothetical protein
MITKTPHTTRIELESYIPEEEVGRGVLLQTSHQNFVMKYSLRSFIIKNNSFFRFIQ